MKKISTKQTALILQLTTVIVIIFLTIKVQEAECFSTADADAQAAMGHCNGTRISDCLPDEEEFLMESQTGRRILQARKIPTIGYKPTVPKRPFCNRDNYGSCIGRDSKNYKKRPCNYLNTCDRKPKNKQ